MSKFKNHKTNVARLLDSEKIPYELISYTVDVNDLSALHVANQLGQNISQIFKTLLLKGDKTIYFVCLVPGDKELNLKLAAQISGNKKCELVPMKDLFNLTGYVRGGCSPIGMKKKFPTFIDESCLNFNEIFISAGQRGLQIQLDPHNLVEISKAIIVKITD
ncbi:Cys-tRNA(Pro) deacylase [Apibacter sp. HY039]|uniref:Cys-tRNA(Pro) deacylase n=1 Tax=Apibacter sp. HY039 TaxID=2501476 RepID=UPI000FEC183B|nr:Cys-tRNA(Pro) deacylase [Apibacter sp. HY039]